MAGIPDAILEQEARVNKMIEELNRASQPSGNETPPVETGSQPTEPVQPTETQPAVEDNFQAKYDTLMGKYNSELARLNNALSELRVENADLRARTAEMMAVMNQPKPSATPSAPDVIPEKVKKLQEDIPEAFDTMDYLLEKKLQERLATMEKKLETSMNEVNSKITSTSQQGFFERMDVKMPDWETVNNDPSFTNWLSRKEGYTGATYHDLLKQAVARKDLEATLKFFTDYKETVKKPAPPAQPGTSKFIAPPKGTSAQPNPQDKEVEMVTTSFIRKFGQDIASGKYKGREEEVEKINRKINIALANNKVIRDS